LCTWLLFGLFYAKYSDALFRVKRFHTDAIKAHNMARFLHNSPPLAFSVKLADEADKTAADYLDKLQRGMEWDNFIPIFRWNTSALDSRRFFDLSGENAWRKNIEGDVFLDDDADEWPQDYSVLEPVKAWYRDGGEDYEWHTPSNYGVHEVIVEWVRSFALIVWNTTLTAGCGYAKDWERVVIVCRYHPRAVLGGHHWKIMHQHVPPRAYPMDFFPEFTFKLQEDPNRPTAAPDSPTPTTTSTTPEPTADYSWMDEPLE
jgi:hypothetical protein